MGRACSKGLLVIEFVESTCTSMSMNLFRGCLFLRVRGMCRLRLDGRECLRQGQAEKDEVLNLVVLRGLARKMDHQDITVRWRVTTLATLMGPQCVNGW